MTSTTTPIDVHHEIAEIINRLGVVLDEGCFEAMPLLLTEDVIAETPGGVAHGRDAVVAQAARNHRPEQRIQHVITNLLVTVDEEGDFAVARANLVVHFAALDDAYADPERTLAPPLQFSLGEVYRFDLMRTADGWRLSRIETDPLWVSGAPTRTAESA